MHLGAHRWVQRHTQAGHGARILDVGGRNVNGTVRDLFPSAAVYLALDIAPGPGVDIQCDFLHYWIAADQFYDVILHLETAEHTPDWRDHIAHAAELLRPDGMLIFTAAGRDRLPHSALDGGALRAGEHYENIESGDLAFALDASFSSSLVRQAPGEAAALRPGGTYGDVYATARK